MTNRARWILLVVLATVAALGAGAFAAYASLENRIETRLEALRASTPDLESTRSPESRELSARLDAIDRWVRENTTLDDHFASPWLLAAEDVVDLPGRLDRMGPFLERVDVLTSSDACRRSLDRGEYLEMPTRRLMFARTRTNLLCARAWVDQRVAGDAPAAARRLGQALDLARLGDDGRAIGLLIDIASEQIVLSTIQEILLDPRCDAKVLHEELDARLARMRDPVRLRRTLILEVKTFQEHVQGKGFASLVHELRYLEALERALALARLSGIGANTAIRSSELALDRYDSALRPTVQSWHLARTRTELGRAALAVAARSDAPLPIDPYSDGPFVRETTPSGERISSPAAIASLGDASQPCLLSWTLPR